LPKLRDQALRDRALTHRSYSNEHPGTDHNERLEFLGDAVLGFIVGDWLYQHYPHLSEAQMTRLRSSLVDEPHLAQFARQLQLGSHLKLGRGMEREDGREHDSILSDALEAYIAACYLDAGLAAVRQFVEPMIEAELARQEATAHAYSDRTGVTETQLLQWIDPKSQLQQWAQAKNGEVPHYELIAESGPAHDKLFVVQVLIGDRVYGKGEGRRKQIAEKAAAQAALAHLSRDLA